MVRGTIADMRPSPRTVLIPMVGLNDGVGCVARIHADDTAPVHNPAALEPRLAELSDWNLYEAGSVALGAIRRLHLRRRRWGFLRNAMPSAVPAYVTVTNGPDLVGLSPDSSRSAELGLALAALMFGGQSQSRIAIATGALARDAGPRVGAREDVAVEAVSEIDRKIATLIRLVETGKGDAFAPRMTFFLPERTLSGASTLEQYADAIERLEQACRRAGLEIDVVPVATLRQALTHLGITSLAPDPREKLLGAGLAAAVVVAMAAIGVQSWLGSRITLEFAGQRMTDGALQPTPIRAALASGEALLEQLPICRGRHQMPVYRDGEWLVMRVRVAGKGTVTGRLGGYHLMIVSVSEKSGIKVFPPETIAANPAPTGDKALADDGADLSVRLPIKGPDEDNKLIILARRLWPFDAAALRAELEAVIAGKAETERINASVAYLAARMPGYLDYSFRSATGEPSCDTQ